MQAKERTNRARTNILLTFFKVVKYWPEKGKSGFIVWRYLLRRDDEVMNKNWNVKRDQPYASLNINLATVTERRVSCVLSETPPSD